MEPGDRIRVLVLITRGEPGGAQVHVHQLVRGLKDRFHVEVGVGDEGFLAGELRTIGIPVHVLPALQRAVSPATDLAALRMIRALIRKVRPALVHTHSTKAGLLGRLAARLEGVPALHTAHAWSFSDGIPWRQKGPAIPIEALAGRITRRFIVVSEADRQIALRYHVARDRQLRVVHNGVEDSPLRARPGEGEPPVLVMVARMAAPKDHLLLLRALSGIGAPFRLQLVGDGPDRPAVEAAIREHALGERVDLLGTRRDVDAILAHAQVAILASRQEGFPLVVLEAMRAGLPVVASDVGGIKEAVQHEITGLLVGRGDEAGLRASLQRLLVDADLRRRMGEAGRQSYERRFTVDQMLAGTAAVYREIASEAAR